MDPTLTPLQVAARRVEAAKFSEQELADLRARVQALESKQADTASASPPPAAEMTKEEKWADLCRQIEATDDNAEVWRLSAELDKLRWS